MDHEYCKQHPRSMPAPAMAAIGVQREPKIDNLRARVRGYGSGASTKSGRLITLGINCSTRFAGWRFYSCY